MKRLIILALLVLLVKSGELRAQSCQLPLINHLNIWNTCLQQPKIEAETVRRAEKKIAAIQIATFSTAITPNPAQNATMLSVTIASRSSIVYRVYDISGRIIQTVEKPDQIAGTHEWLIDMARLPSGAYIVSVSDGKTQQSLHLNIVR